MEKFNINEVRDEISMIRIDILNSDLEKNTTDRIDHSLDKIIRLLDPRPPASENNFCPNCGNRINTNFDKLNSNINPLGNLDSNNNSLENKKMDGN